ncbi:MAG: cytochrome c [Deltaproteobacteria bacterium]|nr:cytochrome c [Deltaproteobacteria bacterium]
MMKGYGLKRCATILLMLFCAAITAHAETNKGAPENPLIEEMRLLDGVYAEIVNAVALNNPVAALEAIERLESSGLMEKTVAGVSSGAIKTPKNSDKLSDFTRFDKEFHANLALLAKAAAAKDQPRLLSFTKKLLDGCVKCHRTYRK